MFHTVATAIRVEYEEKTDTVYLVFEIEDEQFKKRIKDDWTEDIELRVIDKKLVLEE